MSQHYLRIRKGKDHLVLETAVKTYYNQEKDSEVKLAGMDHVATKDFFKKMFSTLDSLENILYECTGLGKISKSQEKSKFYMIDRAYKNIISEYAHAHGLYFQHEIIPPKDYGKHWKHCDIGLDEEIEKMEKSDEDLNFMVRQIASMKYFSEKSKTSPTKREESLYMQARMVQEGLVDDKGKVVIDYRNSLVIDELKSLINERKAKRLGVMYGADHMPEISGFLESHGFSLKNEEWVEAWRVKDLKKDYFD
jgi:hypothetical protein